QQAQRVTFFWEGDEINYRVDPIGGSSVTAPQPARSPSQLLETAPTLPKMTATRVETLRAQADTGAATPRGWILDRYETQMDRLIGDFYRQVVGSHGAPFPSLEESSALRGRQLARIVNRSLAMESSAEDTQPSLRPLDVAVKVQEFLNRAYRHLDF